MFDKKESKVNYSWLKKDAIYDIVCDTEKSFTQRYEAYEHIWCWFDIDVIPIMKELIRLRDEGIDITQELAGCNYNNLKKEFEVTLDILDFERERIIKKYPDDQKRENLENQLDRLRKM